MVRFLTIGLVVFSVLGCSARSSSGLKLGPTENSSQFGPSTFDPGTGTTGNTTGGTTSGSGNTTGTGSGGTTSGQTSEEGSGNYGSGNQGAIPPNPYPAPLAQFVATTGTQNHGDIQLNWVYPAITNNYKAMWILRVPGATPPDSSCFSNGTLVTQIYSPLQTSYVDATGAQLGESFSYRVCILSVDPLVPPTSVNIALNVKALDKNAPMALAGFSAMTGDLAGEIKLSITYPSDISDYAKVEIRRRQGLEAPSQNCNDGTVIYSTQSNFVSTTVIDQTNSEQGEAFSYTACIYDGSNNFVANTVAGVEAKPACDGAEVGGYCWYLAPIATNCATMCGNHDAEVDDGLEEYIGDDVSRCGNVLQAVGAPSLPLQGANGPSSLGCGLHLTDGKRYLWLDSQGDGSIINVRRACSCTF